MLEFFVVIIFFFLNFIDDSLFLIRCKTYSSNICGNVSEQYVFDK